MLHRGNGPSVDAFVMIPQGFSPGHGRERMAIEDICVELTGKHPLGQFSKRLHAIQLVGVSRTGL